MVVTDEEVRAVLRRLDPEIIKVILLAHTRKCKNKDCHTCFKLSKRLEKIKKRKARWQKFRALARVVAPLIGALSRASERVYAPGGAGALEAEREFSQLAHK